MVVIISSPIMGHNKVVQGSHIIMLFSHFIRLEYTSFQTWVVIFLQAFLSVISFSVKGSRTKLLEPSSRCGYCAMLTFFGGFLAKAFL